MVARSRAFAAQILAQLSSMPISVVGAKGCQARVVEAFARTSAVASPPMTVSGSDSTTICRLLLRRCYQPWYYDAEYDQPAPCTGSTLRRRILVLLMTAVDIRCSLHCRCASCHARYGRLLRQPAMCQRDLTSWQRGDLPRPPQTIVLPVHLDKAQNRHPLLKHSQRGWG